MYLSQKGRIRMRTLTAHLKQNVHLIQQRFHTKDAIRSLSVTIGLDIHAELLYLPNTVDEQKIHSFLLAPIQQLVKQSVTYDQLGSIFKDGEPSVAYTVEECVDGLVNGRALLMFNKEEGYLFNCSNWRVRSVEVPLSSSVYEGPASGLTEDISVNLNLLRNYYRSPNLVIETLSIGSEAKKEISILSVHGVSNPAIVEEVKARLNNINVSQAIINQLATDALEGDGLLFPRTMSIDRPDACAMALAAGRVVILVEGSPLALLAPSIFYHFFQNQDDYLSDFGKFGSRPLRYSYFFIATFTPAIIVAIERFHLDLIPRDLHEQLIKTHDTLAPFTIELLFVILLMQVIMDGSYRLPGNVIFAVTFIGTMLISDVATDVNLFHPVTIVIIGICYISSFPVLHRGLLSPIFFMRLSFIILAHFFGFAGLFLGTTVLLILMAKLHSIGTPYLYPFLPFQPDKWKDTLFRGGLQRVINHPNPLPFNRHQAKANRKQHI
ncbi:hypothetical protein EH196_01460 [Bacillus sp. C1-1]|uniref:Spore germination protein n=2 Tax=Shouchella lehensis TaxID=300825 RepID=A0A4Y7WL80_9BACI|nr:hypothetical protein EH196_01460 [Bacillus sp. C1-1]TES49328.1 hypothetical protein E2L03_07600 [Shouchella lehensis]